ncbi:MAG: DEAD/DEAH box helicase family protein [Planctomycetaceae bacterium]|nr:DEAD/DEAH box helicase family protein [Planctomycetaceae bacterium]
MAVFGKEIHFRKQWRSYQRRVLSDLTKHLEDGHLHIVAAPGSGKTVLGLEVVRVLGKPAVIFSPTLTIRDQWAERFRMLFCPEGYDAMISTHMDEPALLAHRCVRQPQEYLEEILNDPAFFSSIVIFLWQTRRRACKKLMRVLGVSKKRIPNLDYKWMELLLTGCLYTHEKTFEGPCLQRRIVDQLKRCGAIEKRSVQLRSNAALQKLLTSSISKLDSIREIVSLESASLKDSLRMVILTDYIRRADLPKSAGDNEPVRRMGVAGIFETLRRSLPALKLGVLGRLAELIFTPYLLRWASAKKVPSIC